MNRETKARLADYFEAHDLVQLLGLETSEVIDAFEDAVEDALDDLEDIMGVREDED